MQVSKKPSNNNSNNTTMSGLTIPTKKVQLTNLSQLPDNYSETPGGTMFATTPGGTRIIYDRSFLLKMRNSPIASTPPKNLPYIAGVTTGISPESLKENNLPVIRSSSTSKADQQSGLKKIDESKSVKTTTRMADSETPLETTPANEELFSMDM